MKEIVSVDLGSNSFRVLKYDGLNHHILDEYQEAVGLADGLSNTGLISNEAQERVLKAIKKSIIKLNYDPNNAVCVTTAAMRMANNSKDVLKRFKKEAGLAFRIIDGEEEAQLTLLAIRHALKREKKDCDYFVLIDIGGGSTELIINNGENYQSKSFNLGIVTLAQKSKNIDQLYEELEKQKILIFNFLNENSLNLHKHTFVATAGTPTTIAAVKLGMDYKSYDKNRVNGEVLTLDDVNYFYNQYKKLSSKDAQTLVGTGRSDFIEAGVIIYKCFYDILDKKESIVFDDGLREGVAIKQSLS